MKQLQIKRTIQPVLGSLLLLWGAPHPAGAAVTWIFEQTSSDQFTVTLAGSIMTPPVDIINYPAAQKLDIGGIIQPAGFYQGADESYLAAAAGPALLYEVPGATTSYPDFAVNFLSGSFDTFGTYEGGNPDELSQLWIADIYPANDPADRVYTVSPTGTLTFDGNLENINDLGGLGLLLQDGPVLVWDGGYRTDSLDQIYFGYELAAIPEPSTTSVLALAALVGCLVRRRRTESPVARRPSPLGLETAEW